MATLPADCAVPGLMWPGFILPGEPLTASAPVPAAGAVFSAGAARSAWSAGAARSAWEAGAVASYSQSVLSTQYVQIPVTAFGTAGTVYNPTGDTVQFAFTPATYPVTEPSAWLSGSWVTFPGPAYWAQCLTGPGTAAATALTIGTWQVWVKITDNPEVPVLQPSLLTITP